MNKFKLASISFVAVGIVCFVVAFYAFQSRKNLIEILDYYSMSESVYSSNSKIAETLFDLKYGVVKYTIAGTISCLAGIILAFKGFNKKKS